MISSARSLMLRKSLTRTHRKNMQKKKSIIQKGDVNLSDLLFTKNRDYLVKYNNNQEVKAEELEGKVIVLLFLSLAFNGCWSYETAYLVDIYNDLLPKACFQVVFVAVRDPIPNSQPKSKMCCKNCALKRFQENFSGMPWPAIPFSDVKSRKSLEIRFGISNYADQYPPLFVIDPTGVVLQSHVPLTYFRSYGVAAYPFSDQRMNFLISQDNAAKEQPSMKALLASDERDYLINNKGVEVPIQDLENKVVAFYFYEHYLANDYKLKLEEYFTMKLKKVYQELAKNMQDFEVVLIYIYDSLDTRGYTNEESFWKVFKTMPWLALPYKDSNIKKLVRVLGYPILAFDKPKADHRVVIVGPHGNFIEPYGADILVNFGCPAYPFTRERVLSIEAEYIKTLKLDMFWEPETIFRQKDGSNVRFSQLVGKRVLLIVDGDWVITHPKFMKMLRERYLQMKYTENGFEVIHLSFGKKGSALPWLTHPPFVMDSHGYKLLDRLLGAPTLSGYGLLAFDRDGRIVRRTIVPTFESKDMDFPFYAGDLGKEALIRLKRWFRWEDPSDDVKPFDVKPFDLVECSLDEDPFDD